MIAIFNVSLHRIGFMFRNAERTFTTAECTFRSAEYRNRSAEHKTEASAKQIQEGYAIWYKQ